MATWRPGRPNILVTGTPGTGKTTLSATVARELGLRHIDVGDFARERNLLHTHDPKLDCHFLHEDAVLDELEPIMTEGGVVLDHHSSDWFPERWIQLVIVLRSDTEVLYDRLEARNYPKKKVDENMEAEIMQVSRDEAEECYSKIPLLELMSNDSADSVRNLARIKREWSRITSDAPPSADELVR